MNKKNIHKTKVIRVFEAFAGIGAQKRALDKLKANYEIVGMAEWYVPAIVGYEAIHNKLTEKKIKSYIKKHKVSRDQMIKYLESKPLSMDSKTPIKKGYWGKKKLDFLRISYVAVKQSKKNGNIFDVHDLYKLTLKNIDLLTYSFPCQDLSQQGKQRGMSKKSNTRSGLLWQIEKALDATNKKDLPKYLLMENVESLLYKTNKKELNSWLKKLESLNYTNSIGKLNAGDFGSPQIRRRTFMISTLKGNVKLPIGNKKPKPIKHILNKEINKKDLLPTLDKYDLTKFRKTKSNINKSQLIGYSSFNSETYVYDEEFSGPTLTASGANSRIKIKNNGQIRKLNAEEAFAYMGFKKQDFHKLNNLNYFNEAKLIYLCGNSISIEVLTEIMRRIVNG